MSYDASVIAADGEPADGEPGDSCRLIPVDSEKQTSEVHGYGETYKLQVTDRKVSPWLYVQLAEEKLIKAKSSPLQDVDNIKIKKSNVKVLEQKEDEQDDVFTRLESLLTLRCENNDDIINTLIASEPSSLLQEAKRVVDRYSLSYTSLGLGLVSFLSDNTLETMIIVRDPLLLFTTLNRYRGEDDKNNTCKMFVEHGEAALKQVKEAPQSVNIDALHAHMARQRDLSAKVSFF